MEKRIVNRFRELLAIKERRDHRTISQREVAEKTGLAKTTVDRIARNESTRYDEHVLLKLCNYLGCTVGDLLIIEGSGEDESQGQEMRAAVAY